MCARLLAVPRSCPVLLGTLVSTYATGDLVVDWIFDVSYLRVHSASAFGLKRLLVTSKMPMSGIASNIMTSLTELYVGCSARTAILSALLAAVVLAFVWRKAQRRQPGTVPGLPLLGNVVALARHGVGFISAARNEVCCRCWSKST